VEETTKNEDINLKEENKEEVKNENNSNNTNNLEQKIEEQQKIIDEQEDRLKRLMAEFENYKKRTAKDRENLYGSLTSDIITSILPVIDNLEKAANTESKDESYKQGIEMLLKQFIDVLNSLGVKQIEALGQPFNPEFHEAVSSVVDETLGEKIVKEEYRKGYMTGNKVIRHSMVIVAN